LIAALAASERRLAWETEHCHKLELLKHGLMEDLLIGHVRVTNLLNEAAT
jgi:hypothetical protein